MRLLDCGERALLLELDTLAEVVSLHEVLRADAPDAVTDLVPAARTLLVRFDGGEPEPGSVRRWVQEVVDTANRRPAAASVQAEAEPDLELPVRYDGPDLGPLAERMGMTAAALVRFHTGRAWRVAFCGFAPGFGYLVGEGGIDVPRLSTPRTRVPSGSVGLAGEFTGVYPGEYAGGWQLIGRTEAALWDPHRDPPALLRPGVVVAFREQR